MIGCVAPTILPAVTAALFTHACTVAVLQTRRGSITKMLRLAMDFAALVDRVAVEPKSKLHLEEARLASIDKVGVHMHHAQVWCGVVWHELHAACACRSSGPTSTTSSRCFAHVLANAARR